MKTIRVNLKNNSYPIYVGAFTNNQLIGVLKKQAAHHWIVLLTHPRLYDLYGRQLEKFIRKQGSRIEVILVPEGERTKSWKMACFLYSRLLRAKVDQGATFVAMGGGVVGDLGGFVAATYRRGMPLVQVPTSLLAQVDSSIGGKVAIDHPSGKNMIGCFYQPRLVFSSLGYLKSLPLREIRNGLAEIIKSAVVGDPDLFLFIENHVQDILKLKASVMEHIIWRTSLIKARIVEKDEREEKGKRAFLNFGHTVGHAIETVSGYKGIQPWGSHFYRDGFCLQIIL